MKTRIAFRFSSLSNNVRVIKWWVASKVYVRNHNNLRVSYVSQTLCDHDRRIKFVRATVRNSEILRAHYEIQMYAKGDHNSIQNRLATSRSLNQLAIAIHFYLLPMLFLPLLLIGASASDCQSGLAFDALYKNFRTRTIPRYLSKKDNQLIVKKSSTRRHLDDNLRPSSMSALFDKDTWSFGQSVSPEKFCKHYFSNRDKLEIGGISWSNFISYETFSPNSTRRSAVVYIMPNDARALLSSSIWWYHSWVFKAVR